MKEIIFKNRIDAGRQLAQKLLKYRSENPLVLAIPRGGVSVGYEVAKALGAPLDTLVVRKIGTPFNPEFGFGAIAPGDVIMISISALEAAGVKKEELDPIIEREMHEMERRILHYHSGEYSRDAEPGLVIIVDDGLATGVTAKAAIESVFLQQRSHRVIFAAPICARDTAESIREIVETVFVQEVDDLGAVGNWYKEFDQVTDEEVVGYLDKAKVWQPVPKDSLV